VSKKASKPATVAPPTPTPPSPRVVGPEFGLTTLRKVLARRDGSRLCFGDPVKTQGVTVIPVARVRAAGGAGFGRGEAVEGGDDPGGGGGGGYIEADPVGFLTVAKDGTTRYDPIPDPQAHARTARTLASAVATLVAAFAGAGALRRNRSPRVRGGVAGMLRRGD
jgi:uncharacterized spore protein YtfJ